MVTVGSVGNQSKKERELSANRAINGVDIMKNAMNLSIGFEPEVFI
jgi:hypothetical protein